MTQQTRRFVALAGWCRLDQLILGVLAVDLAWYVRSRTIGEDGTSGLEISPTSQTPTASGIRRPHARLTVRVLIIVMAVAALLTGGVVLARRSAHYRRESLYHSRAVERARGAKADYHDQLVKKYKRAAIRRWLLLEPDPPDLD